MPIQEKALIRLFDNMTEGVLIIDEVWHIIYANDSARRYLGLSATDEQIREDLIPKLTGRFILSTDLLGIHEDSERSIAFEAINPPEISYNMTLSVYMSRPTEEGYRMLLMRDITEEQREELFKRNFLSLISHKLRTPLNVMKMQMDNMNEGLMGPLNEKQAKAVKSSLKRVRILENMVDRLITFTALQDEGLRRKAAWIDIASETEKICERFKKRCKHPLKINLENKLVDNRISFREKLFSTLIENVLDNSVKFSNKPEATVDIEFKRNADTEELTMSIRDDGPGIPPTIQFNVFQPFTQRDDDFTGNVEGMGLGLPTVYHLMQLSGGRVELESTHEGGTIIRLFFPPLDELSSS